MIELSNTTVYRKYIDIYNEKSFKVNVTLEGKSAILTFDYNFRTKRYHATMSLATGEIVFDGLAIEPETSFPLTANFKVSGFNGMFALIPNDTSLISTDTTLENWATYYFLVYRIII